MARSIPVDFKQFAGINNVLEEHRLKPTDLRGAVNVDIDADSAVVMRRGHGAPLAGIGTNPHSLFYPYNGTPDVCLFRHGTVLYRLLHDYDVVSLKTGLEAGAKMTYAPAGGRIFMSDGFWAGWTDGETVRDWGIVPPRSQGVASTVTHGRMPAGKYRYAVTFLRDDGEESGTGESGFFELTTAGGVEFSQLPVSAQADVTMKAMYLSKPGGQDLFRAFIVPNAATTGAYFGAAIGLGAKLETQLLREPPRGRVIEAHNGRMLVADGRFLWYNPRPYQYERFSARWVRPQTSNITALAVMDDGVFVGTETHIDYHAGPDFEAASVVTKAKYGACYGGRAYIEGSRLPAPTAGRAALLVTRRGVCALANGGHFQNLTDARYQYTAPSSVAAVAREMDGFSQLIAVMR